MTDHARLPEPLTLFEMQVEPGENWWPRLDREAEPMTAGDRMLLRAYAARMLRRYHGLAEHRCPAGAHCRVCR